VQAAGRLLANTAAPLVGLSQRLGRLAPTRPIELLLALRLPAQAALDRFVSAQYTPGNRLFHRFLTPAQFAARFGAPPGEINRVLSALRALGLADAISVPANHLYVKLTAPVGRVALALGTVIDRFRLHESSFFANAGAVRLPASLAGLVSGVVGLDSAGAPRPALVGLAARRRAGAWSLTLGALPERAHALAPQRATAGGAQPCPAASLSGQTR